MVAGSDGIGKQCFLALIQINLQHSVRLPRTQAAIINKFNFLIFEHVNVLTFL